VQADPLGRVSSFEVMSALRIDDDTAFHEWGWRAQKVGWTAMLAFAIAALTGAFGEGPVSHRVLRSADRAVAVRFEGVTRVNAPWTLDVEASADAQGALRVSLDRAWLDGQRVVRITPEPARTEAGDPVGFVFDAAPGAAATVAFELEPKRAGRTATAVSVAGRSLAIRQLVFP
jgi:hypothetical protein